MTREEKIARAVELRGDGVTLDELATYLGVSKTTALRWSDPDENAKDRARCNAYKTAHRREMRAYYRRYREETKEPCPWCGTPRQKTAAACKECQRATDAVRRSLIEGMWADGWPTREISAAIGCSARRVGAWRAEGWDLPHRCSPKALANLRAGSVWLKTG